MCTPAPATPADRPTATNPTALENQLPGDANWHDTVHVRVHQLEGYLSADSVAPGDELQFHISTNPSARYRIDLFRLGWYGGAGARLVQCLPSCTSDELGQPRPIGTPDQRGVLAETWPVTDVVRVPDAWVSGLYLARLALTPETGPVRAAWVPFVVRSTDPRPSAVLVQLPTATWQAYNNWGGKSLYDFNSTGPAAVAVSSLRPFTDGTVPLAYEYPVVQFLEANGYDVSYQTDADTDEHPTSLLSHRAVIVAGHDEYWTQAIRSGFARAVRLGTNLAFVGADIGYWRVRYENDRRTLVEYRSARLDPDSAAGERTGAFRSPAISEPECRLLGIEYAGGTSTSAYPVTVASQASRDPWFDGTGLLPGTALPGLASYEWDSIVRCPHGPHVVRLFASAGAPITSATIRYTAPSGARVFSAGIMRFGWALSGRPGWGDADPRMQQFFRNVLDDLSRPAPPRFRTTPTRGGLLLRFRGVLDPRIRMRIIAAHPVSGASAGRTAICRVTFRRCFLRLHPGRYSVSVIDRDIWGASRPTTAIVSTLRNAMRG